LTEHLKKRPENLDVSVVEASGLLDRDWYLASYPEAGARAEPLIHYCQTGWREGWQPNPYFDPAWYSKTYGTELVPDENPLLHYIRRGERENSWPSPHFDPEWYRDEYAIDAGESPLRHYLLHRGSGKYSPLPIFDVSAFVEGNPEWMATGLDPYLHSLQQPNEPEPPPGSESPMAIVLDAVGGNLEQGSIPDAIPWEAFTQALRLFIPHIPFDDVWYCRHYPDVAAAVKCGLMTSAHEHFVNYGFFEGRSPAPPGRWMAP
jgi:hypothetical protein